MVAVWQSSSAAGGTLGTDPTVSKPPGTGDGDLLIAVGLVNGANTIEAPAGSNWVTHPDSIGTNMPLWTINSANSEPANWTFVTSGVAAAIVRVVRITGHDPSAPIDVVTSVTGLGDLVLGTLTPFGAQRLLMQMVNKLNNTTFTPPGTTTERYDSVATGFASAGGDEIVGASPTGTRTWTPASGGNTGVGYMLAIKPAQQTITVSGFAPTVAFGTPTLVQDQVLSVSGFAPVVQFGSPALRQNVTPSGFDIAVSFGTPTLAQGQLLAPAGFDLDVQFGTPTLVFDQALPVAGFQIDVEFGTPTVSLQPMVSGTVFNHETGIPVGAGVVVRLFDDNDVLIDTTVTDGSGSYVFHRPFGDTDLYWTLAAYDVLGVQYHGVSDRGCPAV